MDHQEPGRYNHCTALRKLQGMKGDMVSQDESRFCYGGALECQGVSRLVTAWVPATGEVT